MSPRVWRWCYSRWWRGIPPGFCPRLIGWGGAVTDPAIAGALGGSGDCVRGHSRGGGAIEEVAASVGLRGRGRQKRRLSCRRRSSGVISNTDLRWGAGGEPTFIKRGRRDAGERCGGVSSRR